ncbi:GH39 family glycosyl hydrolase [Streptomyces scopuliridis]|uniref:Beta-xylosidase n=1 Tax=Streptomyces scopuliridis RB72 TaxID=1440053 RepID=A0A2T7T267_9ACTN|nr:beta-xylosidase [Streptomyces scopuliridis]PVE09247.1 beta-xylosidase [Streptomyces scopuliridis RB72]
MSGDIFVSALANTPATPLPHFWSRVVGAGRANEGLRADWQRQLREAHEACGFEYIRFHGLFHDDMFVYTERADGTAVHNFQYVDALFDFLLDLGVRPFVEFGFSPRALARETNTVFWWGAHGAPPVDLGKWAALIESITRHWITRYGIEEVRRWYFEVWNEANLRGFFHGTRSEYFELYKVTAGAVKNVDERLRVGGPATSNFVPDERFGGESEDVSRRIVAGRDDIDDLEWRPVWMEAFLDYCAGEGLPVDFVSTHPYPTDWALDEHGQGEKLTRGKDATPVDLALLRDLIAKSPYPDAEIHLTEWSSSSSPRDHTHDTLPAATYVTRSVLHSLGTVDSLAYWTFTDVFEEGGAGDELFHGGFGMITLPGIPKPTFHAYRMLHALGDELIERGEDHVVTRSAATGRITALVHHYPEEEPKSVPASFDDRAAAEATQAKGRPRRLTLEIGALAAGAPFRVEVLDSAHGDAIGAWRALGSPAAPTREQLAHLDRLARATEVRTIAAGADGVLRLDTAVSPWSLVLIEQLG